MQVGQRVNQVQMKANGADRSSRKGCIQCSREFSTEHTLCPHDGTRLTTLGDSDLVGTVLADRYEILEVIGGGGMGLVYKARQRLMNRIVAIKMLHRHMISSAEALKRFQLEAQAASRLSLPNILTIYDFELTPDGQPYMVMDYLEGASLADLLEDEGHLPVLRSLNIFAQVCAGLWHAHQKGIIHRDLKPSNIMLVTFGDETDFVKIVDFGIAKLLRSNDHQAAEQLTRTGEVFGSPLYMSPEQCKGKVLDQRSDIYSLGSVMYRTLTGHPLFSGEEVVEFLFKQVSELPLPFEEIAPQLKIPKQVQEVVFKALEKDPDKRWQSMSELKDALEFLKNQLAKEGNQEPMTAPRQDSNSAPPEVSPQAEPLVRSDRSPSIQKMPLPEYAVQDSPIGAADGASLPAKPLTGLGAELGSTGSVPVVPAANPQQPQPGFPVAPAKPQYQQSLQSVGTSTNSSLPSMKPLSKGAVPRPGNIPILKAGYQTSAEPKQPPQNPPEIAFNGVPQPTFSEPAKANVLQNIANSSSPPHGFSNPVGSQNSDSGRPQSLATNGNPSEIGLTPKQTLEMPLGSKDAQAVPGMPSIQAVRLDRIPQDAVAPKPHIQPMAPLDRIFALPSNPPHPHSVQQNPQPPIPTQNSSGQTSAPPAPSRPNFEQPVGSDATVDPRMEPLFAGPPTMNARPVPTASNPQQQRISKPDYRIVPDNPGLKEPVNEQNQYPRRAGFESNPSIGPTGTQIISHLPEEPVGKGGRPFRNSAKSSSKFDSQRYSHLADSSPGLLQNKRLYMGIGFGVLILFGITFAVQEFFQREEGKTTKSGNASLTRPIQPQLKTAAVNTRPTLVPSLKLPSAASQGSAQITPGSRVSPPSVASRTVNGHQDVSKPKAVSLSPAENIVRPAIAVKKHRHINRPAYQTTQAQPAPASEQEKPVQRHAYSTYGY